MRNLQRQPLLGRRQPGFFQPGDHGLPRVVLRHVLQRPAAPQGFRLCEELERVAAGAGFVDEVLELQRVELIGLECQHIAGAVRAQAFA
ncbi:hypothetical protein BBK82_33020 [Lentzea guizhouensis]|uniref:Uncharacterized protein n=1 Tax=Lentzea guizhouensis TaxID=1586287 RepID=A0A1B2HR04_9PSEU|nr:hypothetical protein BBK82_33020 [Lentzea guizhouensis]